MPPFGGLSRFPPATRGGGLRRVRVLRGRMGGSGRHFARERKESLRHSSRRRNFRAGRRRVCGETDIFRPPSGARKAACVGGRSRRDRVGCAHNREGSARNAEAGVCRAARDCQGARASGRNPLRRRVGRPARNPARIFLRRFGRGFFNPRGFVFGGGRGVAGKARRALFLRSARAFLAPRRRVRRARRFR